MAFRLFPERAMTLGKLAFLSLFLGFVTWVKCTYAEPIVNYTAVMSVNGKKVNVAYLDNMLRVEHPEYEDIINITMPAEKKFIVFSTATETYYEKGIRPDFYEVDVVVEKTKKGSDIIDGHPCTRYEGVFYRKDKPDEKNETIEWDAEDLGGLAIKVKMRDYRAVRQHVEEYTTMELKNIKPGGAKKEMFQIPEYYRKVKLLKEVLE